MSEVYGIFQDRFKCTCGTYLILMEKEGLTTEETMKCHGCGKIYDFEITLSNARYEDNNSKTSTDSFGETRQ